MKEVLVFNQYAAQRGDGAGTRHVELFDRLSGWRTQIVAASRAHTTQERLRRDEPGFTLLPVPRYTSNGLARVVGFFSYFICAIGVGVFRRRPDVVYGSSPHLLAPFAALIVARLRRVPFVLEVRDLWPESIVSSGLLRRDSLIHRALKQLERTLARGASRIVVVTPGWEDHFRALGVPLDRIVVVPNGADPAAFAIDSDTDVEERRNSEFTAIFAGTHGPKDGVDYVIDAARDLPAFNFLMVGSGPSKAIAEDRVVREGIKNVTFIPRIPKPDLAKLLHNCDVGIHSVTPYEVFQLGMSPNKLFDYLAAGLPVVSNAGYALRHVLEDGQCGPLGGEHELRRCLMEVATASIERRQRWGMNGVELIESRFSRETSARTLEQTLDALV